MSCCLFYGIRLNFGSYRVVVGVCHWLLLLLLAVVLYGEWWDQRHHHDQWPPAHLFRPPRSPSADRSVTALLVADARISSLTDDQSLSFPATWDSNRFVRRNFEAALSHVRPDVVLFVGATLASTHGANSNNNNKGSGGGSSHKTAEQQQQQQQQLDTERDQLIEKHARQFSRVFAIDGTVQAIGVPEGALLPPATHCHPPAAPSAPQTDDDVTRFGAILANTRHQSVGFVRFFKIGADGRVCNSSYTLSQSPPTGALSLPSHLQTTGVLLSRSPFTCHPPYTSRLSSNSSQVLVSLGVSVVFSAQRHTSYIAVQNKLSGAIYRRQSLAALSSVEHINLHADNVVEIVVPSCNYYNNAHKTGFGVAKIDLEGSLVYSVLWLAPRRRHLTLYLASLLCSIVLLLGCVLLQRQRRRGLQRLHYRHLAED